MFKKISMIFVVMALAAVCAGPALAEYPDRPIKILVGFKAGGGVDTMARLLAKKAGDILGQPVVVVSKPGGGGAIAAKAVLGAKPDGYNLVFSITLTFAGWPHMTKVKYTVDDFTYIASVGKFQEAFVAGSEQPFKDWKGLIEAAKKKEGGLNAAVMTL
jgi:tripartite-type tricarboxylate transporter receptor subunit TctC